MDATESYNEPFNFKQALRDSLSNTLANLLKLNTKEEISFNYFLRQHNNVDAMIDTAIDIPKVGKLSEGRLYIGFYNPSDLPRLYVVARNGEQQNISIRPPRGIDYYRLWSKYCLIPYDDKGELYNILVEKKIIEKTTLSYTFNYRQKVLPARLGKFTLDITDLLP